MQSILGYLKGATIIIIIIFIIIIISITVIDHTV